MRTSLWMCRHPHHQPSTLWKIWALQSRQLSAHWARYFASHAELAQAQKLLPECMLLNVALQLAAFQTLPASSC